MVVVPYVRAPVHVLDQPTFFELEADVVTIPVPVFDLPYLPRQAQEGGKPRRREGHAGPRALGLGGGGDDPLDAGPELPDVQLVPTPPTDDVLEHVGVTWQHPSDEVVRGREGPRRGHVCAPGAGSHADAEDVAGRNNCGAAHQLRADPALGVAPALVGPLAAHREGRGLGDGALQHAQLPVLVGAPPVAHAADYQLVPRREQLVQGLPRDALLHHEGGQLGLAPGASAQRHVHRSPRRRQARRVAPLLGRGQEKLGDPHDRRCGRLQARTAGQLAQGGQPALELGDPGWREGHEGLRHVEGLLRGQLECSEGGLGRLLHVLGDGQELREGLHPGPRVFHVLHLQDAQPQAVHSLGLRGVGGPAHLPQEPAADLTGAGRQIEVRALLALGGQGPLDEHEDLADAAPNELEQAIL
mmetsp:Transcript_42420/g.119994  ORF Transcript_42420/g.119994 Transcript_42420/m.119994 type:complete len:414 (+) Transcript_42420:375-1616(+)